MDGLPGSSRPHGNDSNYEDDNEDGDEEDDEAEDNEDVVYRDVRLYIYIFALLSVLMHVLFFLRLL